MNAPMSPCVSRCRLTEDKICSGCFRSLDEIMEWSKVSSAHKHIIVANALQRANESN